MHTKKHFAMRLLSIFLAIVTILSVSTIGTDTASATVNTKTIYFTSGGYWEKFFAVYAWDDSYDNGEWYTLTAVSNEEDLYYANICAQYNNAIFCSRSKLAFNWDYVVDKTDALIIPDNCNHLTLAGKTTGMWSSYTGNSQELIYFVPCQEWMNIQLISGQKFALHAYNSDDTDGIWAYMDLVNGNYGSYPSTFCAEISTNYDEFEFCRVEVIDSDDSFIIWEKTYSQIKPAGYNIFTQDENPKIGKWGYTEYIEPEIPETPEPSDPPESPEDPEPSVKPEDTKVIFFTANETWSEIASSTIGRISAYAWNSKTSEGTWYWAEESFLKEAEYCVIIDAQYDSILFGITYSNFPDGCWSETNALTIPASSNHFIQDADNECQGTWEAITESASYYVAFVNADGTFISAQVVKEGQSAVPPKNPTIEPDAQYTYTFVGWDTDFTKITKDTTITALYTKTVNKYKVTFKDYNGDILSVQSVEYGSAAEAPSEPERDGYTFNGWDTKFDNITGDVTVTARYIKNAETLDTGVIRIDNTGGTNFTISVDGGIARPQELSYINSSMPVGVSVTVTANGINQFIGWVNNNGLVLTTDVTYTFITTGDDYLKAIYKTNNPEATSVVFKNDKTNQIIDTQYYVEGDEIIMPTLPTNATHLATSWSMTAEEIKASVARGEAVTVVPIWEQIFAYVNIRAIGGTVNNESSVSIIRYSGFTLLADDAPAGQKFAYWSDQNGKPISYKSECELYVGSDTVYTAVFIDENETIDYEIILNVDIDTASDSPDTNTAMLGWEVPEASGIKFVQAGALLVDEEKYNAETFYKGTVDSNVKKWTPTSSHQHPSNFITVNNIGTNPGSTWYIQAWITVEIDGVEQTFYSDIKSVTN
ncbi:MAG: InlB B-repeat-containing protein [Ruminococcus sp.]|nr:InlB B-repeat-containing protein [Ruminococcus sp.]